MGATDRLTVIGSADAFNSAGRNHSCYWLDLAGTTGEAPRTLMIDFGPTALAGLKRVGRNPTELSHIVITHLHGDHIAGLPFLVIDGMYSTRRSAPLLVAGPIGLTARADALLRVTYEDVASRERPYSLSFQELGPGTTAVVAGVRVETFPALHMEPPEQPLCLRLTTPSGRVLAFSGDTAMCDGLRNAARDADLLVAECTAMRPPAGKHCTWEDWRTTLPIIGAKRVLLTHLDAEVRARAPALVKEAPSHVELAFADDGMVLEV